jgi:hypothetical protein
MFIFIPKNMDHRLAYSTCLHPLCKHFVTFHHVTRWYLRYKNSNLKMTHANQGFFFPILWCTQISNDPQDHLVKFGYKLGMKVFKF